jgi:hypothetical protein
MTISLVLTLSLYMRLAKVEGVERILVNITSGITKSEAQQRLGETGRPIGGIDKGHNLNVRIPKGGSVLFFSSYKITPFYNTVDFAVVFNNQNRVENLIFTSQPLGDNSRK